MNIESAKEAHLLLNKIENIQKQIDNFTRSEYVLCFGKRYTNTDSITVNVGENEPLKDIFDKHHQQIIQELKDQISDYQFHINLL